MGSPVSRIAGAAAVGTLSPGYLAHLLRAAVTAPDADAEPAAGCLVADLLVGLAEAGAVADLGWLLAPRPGASSTFEVRSFVPGSLDPHDTFATDDPAKAVLTARDWSVGGPHTVELLSRDPEGFQRCVLLEVSDNVLSFRFPEPAYLEASDGSATGVLDALEAWRAALAPNAPPAAPPPALSPVNRMADVDAVAEAVVDALVADGRALRTHDVADVLASLIPAPADVADLVVGRLVAHFEGTEPVEDR